MRVLVAGATGALGLPLVRALVGQGYQVLRLTRNPSTEPARRGSARSPWSATPWTATACWPPSMACGQTP